MPDEPLTADMIHAQVHAMRALMAEPPERIELGTRQLAAIEAAQREAAGTDDVGPLLEFQGLPIIKSARDDWVKLLAPGEQGEQAEDVAGPAAGTPAAGG